MATAFFAYDGTGGTTFSITSVTVPLDVTDVDEPSGSSPFTLDSNDELTIAQTDVFEVGYDVSVQWNADTVATSVDGFTTWLERDSGGGFSEVAGTRSYSVPNTGSSAAASTASARVLVSVTTGDVIRVRAVGHTSNVTWEFVADGSRLTVTADEDTTTGLDATKAAAWLMAMGSVLAQGADGSGLGYVIDALNEYVEVDVSAGSLVGNSVTDARTILSDFVGGASQRSNAGMSEPRAREIIRRARAALSVYDSDAANPVS